MIDIPPNATDHHPSLPPLPIEPSRKKPRASRQRTHKDAPHILSRISKLEPVAQTIMRSYGGNEPTARTTVLDKLEDYQLRHNEAPIVRLGTQWSCKICDRTFPTLQTAAIHITVYEWGLRSWHCLEVGWYAPFFLDISSLLTVDNLSGRTYNVSNELARHHKESHPQ
jgi:hypothetical protein